MNFPKWFTIPIKRCRSFTFWESGNSDMAFVSIGSACIPCSLIMEPRNFTEVLKNWHFSMLSVSASCRQCSVALTPDFLQADSRFRKSTLTRLWCFSWSAPWTRMSYILKITPSTSLRISDKRALYAGKSLAQSLCRTEGGCNSSDQIVLQKYSTVLTLHQGGASKIHYLHLVWWRSDFYQLGKTLVDWRHRMDFSLDRLV